MDTNRELALKWWNDIGSKIRIKYTSRYFPNPHYLVEKSKKRIEQIWLKEGKIQRLS
jgi:hypothetical protein